MSGLAVVVLGAGATTLPVGAAAHAAHRAHVTVRTTDARSRLVHAALHRARPTTRAQLVARHGADVATRLALGGGSASVVPDGQFAVSLPVDPHGTGRQDVLTLTLPDSRPSALVLRSGRTGGVVWRLTLADAWGFELAHLGAAHHLSAVVYETTFTGAGDPAGVQDSGEQSNTVTAVDLTTGKRLWTSNPLAGTFSASDVGFSEADALYPGGVLHDRAGDRVLGLEVSQTFGLAGGAMQAQPVVFDGTTGAMSVLGAPVGTDGFAYLVPLGDVNGDGLGDFAAVDDGDAAGLVVDSGSGPPLWAQPQPQAFFVDAVPAGDLNGDKHPDVLASTDTGADGTVIAYAGGTGTALWTRSAALGVALGTVHGRAVVGLIDDSGSAITASGVEGAGSTIWSKRIAIPAAGGGGFSSFGVELGGAGDIDADRVQDLFVDILSVGSRGAIHVSDTVSGRTGLVRSGKAAGGPLLESYDGHGDDFVDIEPGSHWTMTISDGLSRRTLLATRFTAPGKPFVLSLDVAHLTGHRGAAVVYALWDGHHTHVTALAGRGHRLWDVVV